MTPGPSVHVAAGSATAPRETTPRRSVCGNAGVRNVRTPARNSRLRGRFPSYACDAALYGPASPRTLAPCSLLATTALGPASARSRWRLKPEARRPKPIPAPWYQTDRKPLLSKMAAAIDADCLARDEITFEQREYRLGDLAFPSPSAEWGRILDGLVFVG